MATSQVPAAGPVLVDVSTPRMYHIVNAALGVLCGGAIATLAMMSPITRAHLVIMALVINLFWRPARLLIDLLCAMNGGRKKLKVGKKEFTFYILALLFSCLYATNWMFSDALVLWTQGVPVVSTAQSLYVKLFSAVFASSIFFWCQLLPAYFIWWVGSCLYWVWCDFNLFLDLGRGGSPPTFRGYSLARWRNWFANVDVFTPPRVPPMADPYRGRLDSLPQRDGPRPRIQGTTPQRITSERAPPGTLLKLERLMEDVVAHQFDGSKFATAEYEQPLQPLISTRLSYLERGLLSIRRNLDSSLNRDEDRCEIDPRDQGPLDRPASFCTLCEFGGELCHGHRDGTSHVVLHEEDCRLVLESGWGERHPFCSDSAIWRFYWTSYLGLRLPVPKGLMIIYPPRNQGEWKTTRRIFEATVWNGTRGDLYPLTADTETVPPAPAA